MVCYYHKWFLTKWTIPNYNNLFHSLIRNFSEGILGRIFDRIGRRDFRVLHRVDVEVARAAASFDGGHHAAEERKVPAVSWLDVVLAVSLLFDGKNSHLNVRLNPEETILFLTTNPNWFKIIQWAVKHHPSHFEQISRFSLKLVVQLEYDR